MTMSRLNAPLQLAVFSTVGICFAFAAFLLPGGNAIAFSISLIATSVGFGLAYFRERSLDVLSPIVGLSILLVLYSLAGAIFVEESGQTYFGEPVPSGTMPKYYAACFLGLASLLIGILWARGKDRPRPLSPAVRQRLDSVFGRVLPVVTSVVTVALVPWWISEMDPTAIRPYAETALDVRVERMADAGSGLAQAFLIQIPIAMLLVWATRTMLVGRRMLFQVLGAVLIADYLLVQMMSGWRSGVVYGAGIVLCYFHYRVHRFRFHYTLLIGVAAYVFINGSAMVRVTSDPAEMVTIFIERLQEEGVAPLALKNSGELVTSVNLVRVISGIDTGVTTYQWGVGWLNELAVLVPRYFYPDRPLPMSEQFVETFYPGVRAEGGGYGFFIIQEGYWQFGFPGVCFSMLLYGYLVERIYRSLILLKGGELHVFAYGFVYSALVISAPRSGAFLSFKAAMINLLGILVVWCVVRLLARIAEARLRSPSFQGTIT